MPWITQSMQLSLVQLIFSVRLSGVTSSSLVSLQQTSWITRFIFQVVGGHLGEVSHPVIILQPEQKRNENSFLLCLLLVYIAINNCDLQVAITTNKWHPQLTVFVARSDFAINKRRWLGLTPNNFQWCK